MKNNFPENLYVLQDHTETETFEVTYRSIGSIPDDEDGGLVAIYKLVFIKKFKVEKTLD